MGIGQRTLGRMHEAVTQGDTCQEQCYRSAKHRRGKPGRAPRHLRWELCQLRDRLFDRSRDRRQRGLLDVDQVVRVEQIAPTRQGLNDLAVGIAENLAQRVDLLVQATLPDHSILPGVAQQLLARNDLAGHLQQALQNPASGKAKVNFFYVIAAAKRELVERAIEANQAVVAATLQERIDGAIGGLHGQR